MSDQLVIPPFPRPEPSIMEAYGPLFIPSHEMAVWIRTTFIEKTGLLFNRDHEHLQQASVAVLWTNVVNVKQRRRIVGRCALGEPSGSDAWAKALKAWQLHRWFGYIPDFIITMDAGYVLEADNAEVCALVEHELYHAAQAVDQYGAPKFTRSGLPVWAIRGHDVEQFIGVVRRYGAEAAGVQELVEVAQRGPTIARAKIDVACSCGSAL